MKIPLKMNVKVSEQLSESVELSVKVQCFLFLCSHGGLPVTPSLMSFFQLLFLFCHSFADPQGSSTSVRMLAPLPTKQRSGETGTFPSPPVIHFLSSGSATIAALSSFLQHYPLLILSVEKFLPLTTKNGERDKESYSLQNPLVNWHEYKI